MFTRGFYYPQVIYPKLSIMVFHFIFKKPQALGLPKLNVIVTLEKKFSTTVIMLKCDNFDFLLMGVDVVAYPI